MITFMHFLHRYAFTAEPFIIDSLERTIESSWKQALPYIGRLIPFFHEISCGLCIIPSSITLLQYGHVIAYTSQLSIYNNDYIQCDFPEDYAFFNITLNFILWSAESPKCISVIYDTFHIYPDKQKSSDFSKLLQSVILRFF